MESRYKELTDTRMVLVGSSPYDEMAVIEGNTPFKGKNEAMLRIVDFQRASAKENDWDFFDLNEPMTDINQKMQRRERSEEHTSELQSLMPISYAVFSLKKKKYIYSKIT